MAVDDGDELVTRAPAQQVPWRQVGLQVRRQGLDDGVAHVVAVRVVHRLQVVHVQEHEQEGPHLGVGRGQARLQCLRQRAEVRQPGQAVAVGQVVQLRLRRLQRADVGNHRDHAALLADPAGAQARDRHDRGHQVPVAVTERGLAAPQAIALQRLADAARGHRVLGLAVEHAGVPPDQLQPGVAGHARQGGVGLDDAAVDVGHHDGLARGLEDPRRGAQLAGDLLLHLEHLLQRREHRGDLVAVRLRVGHDRAPVEHVAAGVDQALEPARRAAGELPRPALDLA